MTLRRQIHVALGGALRCFSKGAQHLERATPHLERAVDWGRRQHSHFSPHLPTANQIEAWVRENAVRYGWTEKPRSDSLEHLERVLTQTIAAICQDSEKRTRIAVNAIIGKTGGALAVGGIAALITNFGAASTGTAIITLQGAAATTAQLYWLGSLIGLGTAAGGLILATTGIGAGIAAGVWGRRWLIGKHRSETELQDHEKAILVACIALINAVKQQIKSGQSASVSDMRLVAEQALIPLANQINQHWDETTLAENGKSECLPFTQNLVFRHRWKLNWCRTEIGRIAMAAMVAVRSN